MSIEVKNLTHTYMPDTPYSSTAVRNVSFTDLADPVSFDGYIAIEGFRMNAAKDRGAPKDNVRLHFSILSVAFTSKVSPL